MKIKRKEKIKEKEKKKENHIVNEHCHAYTDDKYIFYTTTLAPLPKIKP